MASISSCAQRDKFDKGEAHGEGGSLIPSCGRPCGDMLGAILRDGDDRVLRCGIDPDPMIVDLASWAK